MLRTRVIPFLLLSNRKFFKTVCFKNRIYIGDPINCVKLFNDKEVDELAIIDIDATAQGREPDYEYIEFLASQCFMPLAYGGGIKNVNEARKLLSIGAEKVILSSSAIMNIKLISELARDAGSQSVSVCIDVKRSWLGKPQLRIINGKKNTGLDPLHFAKMAENHGAGEIIINSIDRDGMQQGYDLEIINTISSQVNIPVIASGGAGSLNHFSDAIRSGASAVAAGSMFVFHGPHRAVLINYPRYSDLENKLGKK